MKEREEEMLVKTWVKFLFRSLKVELLVKRLGLSFSKKLKSFKL